MRGTVIYFETHQKAEAAEERVIAEAVRIGKTAFTEIQYLTASRVYADKPYALYYEFVKKEEPKEEVCVECGQDVAVGMAVALCRSIKGEHPDCEKLGEQVMDGQMTHVEALSTIDKYITDKSDRKVFKELLDEAGIKLPKKKARKAEPGQATLENVTLKNMQQDDEVKDKIEGVVALVSFFGSWDEVVDQTKLRENGIDLDKIYDEVIAGDMPPSKCIKIIMPYMKKEVANPTTEEEEDFEAKKQWLKDALLFLRFAEQGMDTEDAFERLKRKISLSRDWGYRDEQETESA